MRASAYLAGTIVLIGAYLLVASALALSVTWMGLGILAIAVVAALLVMAGDRPEARTPTAG